MRTTTLPPYNKLGPEKLWNKSGKKLRRRGSRKSPAEVSHEFNLLKNTPRWQTWKRNQFLRQGGTCYYCHEPIWNRRKNIEHIVPRSKGGTNGWSNLVLACSDCNKAKGSELLSREKLKELFIINKKKRGTYLKNRQHYDNLYSQYSDESIAEMLRNL